MPVVEASDISFLEQYQYISGSKGKNMVRYFVYHSLFF